MTLEEQLAAVALSDKEAEAETLKQLQALQEQQATQREQELAGLAAQGQQRQAVDQNLIDGLNNQFITQQQSVANLAPVTSGFESFVDARTGSNFARSAEALVNQRAILAAGQDPTSQAFRDQINATGKIQRDAQISPGQQLQQQLQIAREQRNAQKDELKARLDLEKQSRQAQKDQIDAQLRLRQDARADLESKARIRQGDTRNEISRINANRPRSTGTGNSSAPGKGSNLKTGEIDKITSFDTSRNIVAQFEKLIIDPSNQDFLGEIDGRSKQFSLSQATRNKANGLRESIATLRQDLGKLLEGGKLIGADEAKFERLLPTITDQPEVALQKLRTLLERMETERITKLSNFEKGGFNVAPFKRDRAFLISDSPTEPVQQTPQASESAAAQAVDPQVEAFLDAQGF